MLSCRVLLYCFALVSSTRREENEAQQKERAKSNEQQRQMDAPRDERVTPKVRMTTSTRTNN